METNRTFLPREKHRNIAGALRYEIKDYRYCPEEAAVVKGYRQ